MYRKFLSISLLFLCHVMTGQKIIEKTITGTAITKIQVDAGQCYEVRIKTHKQPKVSIASSLEGEYKEEIAVSTTLDEHVLVVKAGLQPLFENPNDKLSAHKVLSIFLDITVPENFDVDVLGAEAKTSIAGMINQLKVVLDTGDCYIKNNIKNVDVSTVRGDIFIVTNSNEIVAESKYGIVDKQYFNTRNPKIILKSISGNIYISKPE